MAAGGTSFVKTQRIQRFNSLLMSAACEWFLIFLLLVDAVLSYLLAKFARYCQLQPPCLLCSRLDYILGGEKHDFYQNLFCSHHKSEISSLISCHIHGKVADGNRMCDECLLSFTTNTKLNPKTKRLLLGKLGLVIGGCGFQSPSLSKDLFIGSNASRQCTCCDKPWKSGQNTPRSIQLNSPGRAVLKPYVPLPQIPRQSRLNHRDNLKKIRDNFSGPVTSLCLENNSFHPMSHVGYTELRLTSDSESEFPFSDDDDVSSVFRENTESGNDPIPKFTSVTPPKCSLSISNSAKQNSSSPNLTPLHLDPDVEPKISKHHDERVLGSDAVNGHGLDEINWQQANQKSSSSDLPELISLDEVSTSPIVVNISGGESEDTKINSCHYQISLPAPLSDLMTLDCTHAGVSLEKTVDVAQASGTELISETHEEVLEKIGTREETSIETDPMVSESAAAPRPRQENSSKMSKFPVTTEENEVAGIVVEQSNAGEVYEVKEELKLCPSKSSYITREESSIEPDLVAGKSAAPTSPRQENPSKLSKLPVTTEESKGAGFVTEKQITEEVYEDKEELKLSPSEKSSPSGSNISSIVSINHVHYPEIQAEASSSNRIQILQKSASVESGLESLDGSNIIEIEGESTVDRLKQHIEHYKKRTDALYKELDEERNASAIAANEAMAMITRLQEEKAALQMEAHQYLRMMEEQAEHDGEELERANDLLAEREKDIQDLEDELECYRLNMMDEPMVLHMHKDSCELKGERVTAQNIGVPNITNAVNILSHSNITGILEASDEAVAGEISSLEFEEEKLYISQCLKSLEKKLHQIHYNGISSHMPNGRPDRFEDSTSNQHGSSNGEGLQLDGRIEETDLSTENNVNASNESLSDKNGLVASDSDDCSLSKQNNHSTGQEISKPKREVDLVALENEISDLNERLEALEADHHLLEHIINSLRNGSDGKQFIQGIAHQLHELRKIGIRAK